MRVTEMMSYRFLRTEINDINNRMMDLQKSASTGKRVRETSDDPGAVRPILNFRSQIESNDRFDKNISRAETHLANVDGVLDKIGDGLVKVKEHGLHYLSGSLNEDDQQTIAGQVEMLTEEILGLANTRVGNDYLFSGYQVQTRPFQEDGAGNIDYQGDDQKREIEIAPGERLEVTVPGNKVFQGSGGPGPGLFDTLQSIKDEMENLDPDEVRNKLTELDQVMNRVSNERGRVGATMNRLESSQEIRQQATTDLKELLSTYEDADIVEASTKLIQQETSLKAALSVTGRISRISILDYM